MSAQGCIYPGDHLLDRLSLIEGWLYKEVGVRRFDVGIEQRGIAILRGDERQTGGEHRLARPSFAAGYHDSHGYVTFHRWMLRCVLQQIR